MEISIGIRTTQAKSVVPKQSDNEHMLKHSGNSLWQPENLWPLTNKLQAVKSWRLLTSISVNRLEDRICAQNCIHTGTLFDRRSFTRQRLYYTCFYESNIVRLSCWSSNLQIVLNSDFKLSCTSSTRRTGMKLFRNSFSFSSLSRRLLPGHLQ